MARYLHQATLPAPAEEVFAWHARPGALERLSPPWVDLRVHERPVALENGARASMSIGCGPCRFRWTARHEECIPGAQFCDVQESGPMARWRHCHRFIPSGAESILVDEVDYELPGGFAGRLAASCGLVDLPRLFRFREARLRADLQRHAPYRHLERMVVAVSGSTGLVGRPLCDFLTTGGHTVRPLVRSRPDSSEGEIYWDTSGLSTDVAALEGVDAVIHLAGESIAQRWTAAARERLYDSRVMGTRRLCEALAKLERKPRVLVSASAIGFYGDRGDEIVTEESSAGNGFLSGICVDWEAATRPAKEAGIRVVHLRVGIVMSGRGGMLGALKPLFQSGLGGPVGGGDQYISWVALDDLVGLAHWLIRQDDYSGPANGTAPDPVTNREFGATLGSVLNRPSLLPAPAAAVKLALGPQMAEELVLSSTRAIPERVTAAGFEFQYPRLDEALRAELDLPLRVS